jgi:hypothetical protein
VALQHAMPGALATLMRDTPVSDAKVAFAWRSAVGKALGRVTSVRLERATLLVEVRDEGWRQEIGRAQKVILERLAALLGAGVVAELRIQVNASPQPTFRW